MTAAADLVTISREDCDRVAKSLQVAIAAVRANDMRTRTQSRDTLTSLHIAWAVMKAARPLSTPAPEDPAP